MKIQQQILSTIYDQSQKCKLSEIPCIIYLSNVRAGKPLDPVPSPDVTDEGKGIHHGCLLQRWSWSPCLLGEWHTVGSQTVSLPSLSNPFCQGDILTGF